MFKVVFSGEAVVEPSVCLVERLQKDAVVGLNNPSGTVELKEKG